MNVRARFAPVIGLITALTMSPGLAFSDDRTGADQFETLYEMGKYAEAADQAARIGSAQMCAFAARSRIAQVVSANLGEGEIETIERAERDARKALDQEPENVEALIQLIVALGLQARHMGGISAYLADLPSITRTHLETAIRLAPDHPTVTAVHGAWHLEVVATAGAKRAREWYGASYRRGAEMFETALERQPDSIPILYNYALLVLANLNGEDERRTAQALDLVTRISRQQPKEWMDVVLRARALDLKRQLESGDTEELARLVDRQLGVV